MKRPTIDEMLEICESRYTLIAAVAKRARSIVESERKSDEDMQDEISKSAGDEEKAVIKAIQEIYEGQYKIVVRD